MKVPLSWLRELVDVPESLDELTETLDDLGLVVEAVTRRGAGLESVVVARVQEIHAIEGADRIRRVIVDAGAGPLEIVCGAMNFTVGSHVPLAPIGAVLPGDFVITARKMRGVVSNGMLCSGRELGLGDDHAGLLLLDDYEGVAPGTALLTLLGIEPDVVLDIAPEGNRPDAWSLEGVARDLGARLGRTVRAGELAQPDRGETTDAFVSAAITDPELCGALTVAAIRDVMVTHSPRWIRQRLEAAGMRAVNNIVDASNYVMLELGQPTHPYDAALVAGRHLGVRRAQPGEQLETLDGVARELGRPGRGLGDTGVDCVIVDGEDRVIGLAGIMGGASSVISPSTTDVILEAAFFDPMTVARTSKRLSLRSEASNRFERGVDPSLAPRAVARFVEILRESSPRARWLDEPLALTGRLPARPELVVTAEQIVSLLGTPVPVEDAGRLLSAIGFEVEARDGSLTLTPPPARLDVRAGVAGRADVIEEIARLYGYQRLERHTPTWVAPGGLTSRQRLRRRVRDDVVGLGCYEAWTTSFLSDAEFESLTPASRPVRVTNPLTAEESILRGSMLLGLVRSWGRNVERGTGDVAMFELGVVVEHPAASPAPRRARGGVGGAETVDLPTEREQLLILLGRERDDARTAVATWRVLAERWALADVVVRSAPARAGWHPTRSAVLVDRTTGTIVGRVGELDPAARAEWAPATREGRRVGLIEVEFDLLADESLVRRRDPHVSLPSRYPAAAIDLAFLTPDEVNAADLAHAMGHEALAESVRLFDVFRDPSLGDGVRSLAFAVRLCAGDRTLSESDVAAARERLIEIARELGAQLR